MNIIYIYANIYTYIYIYICVCVWGGVYMFIYIYLYIYIYMCIYRYTCIWKNIYTYIGIYLYIYTYIFVYIYMCVCGGVYIHIYIYIYINNRENAVSRYFRIGFTQKNRKFPPGFMFQSGQKINMYAALNPMIPPSSRFYEYIYLYQSMVMFQIDQKTKACSKIALSGSWDPFDIPDNSTFEDQYDIGGPGDSVEVQEWSDRKPARQRESDSFFFSTCVARLPSVFPGHQWNLIKISKTRCCFQMRWDDWIFLI